MQNTKTLFNHEWTLIVNFKMTCSKTYNCSFYKSVHNRAAKILCAMVGTIFQKYCSAGGTGASGVQVHTASNFLGRSISNISKNNTMYPQFFRTSVEGALFTLCR